MPTSGLEKTSANPLPGKRLTPRIQRLLKLNNSRKPDAKMGEGLRHSCKETIQMTNKHRTNSTALSASNAKQRNELLPTPVQTAVVQKESARAGVLTEKPEPCTLLVGMQNGAATVENSSSEKLNTELAFDPAAPLLGTCTEDLKAGTRIGFVHPCSQWCYSQQLEGQNNANVHKQTNEYTKCGMYVQQNIIWP